MARHVGVGTASTATTWRLQLEEDACQKAIANKMSPAATSRYRAKAKGLQAGSPKAAITEPMPKKTCPRINASCTNSGDVVVVGRPKMLLQVLLEARSYSLLVVSDSVRMSLLTAELLETCRRSMVVLVLNSLDTNLECKKWGLALLFI